MRKIHFVPFFLAIGMVACNNATDKSSSGGDTTAKTDTTMNHVVDTAKPVAIEPLPDVPSGARVFFKNLKDGATVKSPLKVEFGVEGISLDSAGKIRPNSGHHHLLIDAGDSVATGTVIPKDDSHKHFGNAQTSAEITLTPGKHVLTLQYADGIHRSYGAKLAKSVTVNVK